MTDLINKVNNLESGVVNNLYKKYEKLIPVINSKNQEEIPYLLYIINLSLNYLNTKYKKETINWKIWAVFLVKKLFQNEIIKTREEIYKHIDNFFEYKKSEYKEYVSNIVMYSDEYYRDINFIDRYVKNL